MRIRQWGKSRFGSARRLRRRAALMVEALESRLLLTTFTDVDIGATGAAGSAALNAGTWTQTGSGADIWSTADAFNFNYATVTGDQTMIARVGGISNTSSYAKAGIMFRESTAAGASFVVLDVTPGHGIEFNDRNGTNTAVVGNPALGTATVPYWVKLVNTGGTFTAYTAADNAGAPAGWTILDSPLAVPFTNSTYLAGLVVCSHAAGNLATGTFSNVVINSAPTIATVAAANPATVVGSTTALSVLGADDGGEGNLTYTWATTGIPPEAVTFTFGSGISNGSNGAKNATANFIQTGLYHFQVTVTDATGAFATSAVDVNVTVPNALPSKPAGIFAQFQGNSVVVSWTAPAGATTYTIYRGATSGGETQIASGISTLTFADTSTTAGQTYYYQVSASNVNGEGTRSTETKAVTGVDATSFHGSSLGSLGVNGNELQLTPANVSVSTFGKAWTASIQDTPLLDGIPSSVLNAGINYTAPSGQAYGEPLVKTGVTITTGAYAGTVHDVVYVSTQVGSLYAIDANTGTPLWKDSFVYNPAGNPNPLNAAIPDGTTAIPGGFGTEINSQDVSPWLCIMGTPVIDSANGYMYLVANTRYVPGGTGGNQANPHYLYTLHKINLANGQDTASVFTDTTFLTANTFAFNSGPYVLGTGAGAVTVNNQSRVYFNAVRNMVRPALELYNGRIYIASASHGDVGDYEGWVITLDANTLAVNGVLCTAPNGSEAGLWASGDGVVFDDQGNFYVVTGNGTFDGNFTTTNGVTTYTGLDANGFPISGDYGNCFIKMTLDPTTNINAMNVNGWGIKVVDYYSPSNNQTLNLGDTDLGSGGAIILPASAGSAAHRNLITATGKQGTIYLLDTNNMGKFTFNDSGAVQVLTTVMNGSFGTPAYFNGRLYYSPTGSKVFSWTLSNAFIDVTSKQNSTDTISYTGASPAISANGISNGIVWALGGGQLRAYDATNLANELWTSNQNAARDAISTVKFSVATPVNGRVYAVTSDGYLVAYETAPAAPLNGIETLYSAGEIDVAWTNASSYVTGWQIQRSTNGGAYVTLAANQATGTTTYHDTGVAAGNTYAYRIVALDPIGASAALGILNVFSGISGGTYTITGAAASGYVLHAAGGTVTLGSDLGASQTIGLDVAAGAVVDITALQHLAGVTIANGATVTLAAGGAATLVAQNITFAGTGKLNLIDNSLQVTGTTTAEARGWITGGQVYSSKVADAAHFPYRALGILQGSDYLGLRGPAAFAGQTVTAGDQLIRYTWQGDANLDGAITADDYLQIDMGYLRRATGWVNGDFNYDGTVDTADYAALAGARAQPGPLSEGILTVDGAISSSAAAPSAVEPAAPWLPPAQTAIPVPPVALSPSVGVVFVPSPGFWWTPEGGTDGLKVSPVFIKAANIKVQGAWVVRPRATVV